MNSLNQPILDRAAAQGVALEMHGAVAVVRLCRPAKRNALVRDAQTRAKEQMWLIPLHHQMRPWAMKAGVSTVHRSDDRPESRFATIR